MTYPQNAPLSRRSGARAGTVRAASLMSIALIALTAGPARAESLEDALAATYNTNPQLNSARAELRQNDELVPQALSNYRPTVTANGQGAYDHLNSNHLVHESYPHSVGLQVTEPLYRGGRTVAQTRVAENTILGQRATLLATEESLLLNAATIYANVVADMAQVTLAKNNEQVLARDLEADRDRFRVGEITRTGVSQTEAQYEQAIASRIQAEGTLQSDIATYIQTVGNAPSNLVGSRPGVPLPNSQDEALKLAEANNPNITAARFAEAAAQYNIELIKGELLPQASLNGSVSRSWSADELLGGSVPGATDATVTASITIPLYQSGSVGSRIRQAIQVANQRQIDLETNLRSVREQTIQAWQALVTARASIIAQQAAVKAAAIALEGVRQEALVGSATVLDTLTQDQTLFQARINLVTQQRNEVVAGFQLLSAIGQMTAQDLHLSVELYDNAAYYNAVKDKWWDWDYPETRDPPETPAP